MSNHIPYLVFASHRLLDIFLNNNAANKLYLNNGNDVFSDATVASGLSLANGHGSGLAVCDTNKDGHQDVYVVNQNRGNVLFRITAPPPPLGSFLIVRPLGDLGHLDLYGTKIFLFVAGSDYSLTSSMMIGMRTIDGGSGYMSQR